MFSSFKESTSGLATKVAATVEQEGQKVAESVKAKGTEGAQTASEEVEKAVAGVVAKMGLPGAEAAAAGGETVGEPLGNASIPPSADVTEQGKPLGDASIPPTVDETDQGIARAVSANASAEELPMPASGGTLSAPTTEAESVGDSGPQGAGSDTPDKPEETLVDQIKDEIPVEKMRDGADQAFAGLPSKMGGLHLAGVAAAPGAEPECEGMAAAS